MGAMPGFQQVSLYIDPGLYFLASEIARRTHRPIYQFVNDAIRAEYERCTTPLQRRADQVGLKSWRKNEAPQGRSAKRNGSSGKRRDSHT